MSWVRSGAESEAHGSWTSAAEHALIGAPTVPAPLGSGAETLIESPARSWNGGAIGTPVLVPYSFATRDSSHYNDFGALIGDGFQGDSEPFDHAQRAAVLEALKLWEQVSGLTFIEVPDAPNRSFGASASSWRISPHRPRTGAPCSPRPSRPGA